MDRARAIAGEDSKVPARRIAFVPGKSVRGILPVELLHHPVACHLGDHAGRSDAQADAVALDDGGVRHRERVHRQTVDQRVVWPQVQRQERPAHGLVRRAEDVQAVHLAGVQRGAGPDDVQRGRQFPVNLLTPYRCQPFGIVQVPVLEPIRQDDGCRDDGTCQRTPTRLVDAGDDPRRAGFAQPGLVFQRRPRRPGRGRGARHRETGDVTWPRGPPSPACPCDHAGS